MPTAAPSLKSRRNAPASTRLLLHAVDIPPTRASFVPDHLGWWAVVAHPGEWCRLAAGDARGSQVLTSPRLSTGHSPSVIQTLPLPDGAEKVLPGDLHRRLAARSPIARIPTPTVWEAAATAVIRQVVHRDQARVSFGRVCETFGATVLIDGQPRYAFPTAEAIIAASEDRVRETGIGFKARTMRTLAEWSLDSHEHLGADELYDALIRVRGIGPWTAAVTVCDVFSDFSYYPVDDLAVRAHAQNRWSKHNWPKAPAAFAGEWRTMTGRYTGVITAFLLADAVLSAPGATLL